MRIGVDLDNTIITYDALFRLLAEEGGFLVDDGVRSKKEVRDTMWTQDGGRQNWTDIQALAYGPRICDAKEFPGAFAFFELCNTLGIETCIVSHKTEFAASDHEKRYSLRDEAMKWLESNGFFSDQSSLSSELVSFASTRQEKVAIIAEQGCDLFIDDLIEVFEEPGFPEQCEQILFGPALTDKPQGFAGELCTHWKQMIRRIENGGLSNELAKRVEAALDVGISKATAIGGGRNSRVYRIDTEDGPYALKHYVDQHRLDNEFAAFAFLQGQGNTQVPGPVVVDRNNGFAVYDFIDGITVSEATDKDVEDCIAFVRALKDAASNGSGIGPAAEAFFCLSDIVGNIRTRLNRLEKRDRSSELENDLVAFLSQDFLPSFDFISERAEAIYAAMGLGKKNEIPLINRTLSSSDFGFHNALRTEAGMVFCDFEYFGWDDPAKLISDFLLHPGMSISLEQRELFGRGVMEAMDDPQLGTRLKALLPLFALKWCMILLNEFLKTDYARRQFAGATEDRSVILERQLAKAKAMLERAKEYAQAEMLLINKG